MASSRRVDANHHFGLQLMRERVDLVGGVLRIDPSPERGLAWWPGSHSSPLRTAPQQRTGPRVLPGSRNVNS